MDLVKLANLIITINKAIACGNRIQEVLEVVPTITDSVTETKKSASGELEVEFSHVSMKYAGNAQDSLTDINLKVKKGQTIGIIGGTGSGKTTFLNALTAYIPTDERIITIEDSAELKVQGIPNLVRLETRNANVEGCVPVTIRDLIKASLRQRPDRICIGEVRGAECIDLLSAMNTGHDGSLSTGHGNSARDMISRLETMVLMGMDIPMAAIEKQIASAIDIFVHLGRLRDKSRKVLEITEVLGYEKGEIKLNSLYRFEEKKGSEMEGMYGTWNKKGELKNTEKLKNTGLM